MRKLHPGVIELLIYRAFQTSGDAPCFLPMKTSSGMILGSLAGAGCARETQDGPVAGACFGFSQEFPFFPLVFDVFVKTTWCEKVCSMSFPVFFVIF